MHRRRALVVQRTGWGKSAVYFVATLLLREQGAGPTVIVSPLLALMRNQIAAAERAGIRAVTINSTNIEQWQPIQDQIAAGEVDVLLVSPERLNNPGFRDQVLPRLDRDHGPARRRRGPLHLRLGPRLPARLPPHPHAPRRAPGRHPGAGDHGHRQRPGHPRRGRAAGPRRAGAPRLARPRVPAARRGPPPDARATARLAGRAPRRPPRLRHRLLPHRGGHPRGGRAPARPRPRGRRRTPGRPSPPSAWPSSRTSSTAGSRRWSRPARSGWASTPPSGS